VIVRVAVRSLATRPLRTAVLAAGFGLAIAVMAELLGVGEVILEQAHSPALRGGGDLVVSGALGGLLPHARFVLSNVIGSARLASRTVAASPSRRTTLYLIKPGSAMPIAVRGGIPSLEKAVGDPEVAQAAAAWVDGPDDRGWASPDQGEVLRAMDRFHPMPSATPPAAASAASTLPQAQGVPGSSTDGFSRTSWAEWLYFNGRSTDGRLRFYLTFLTGPPNAAGKRPALVRLQLDRDGRSANFSAIDEIDAADLLRRAPDMDVGGNSVRLEGLRYHLRLALDREGSPSPQRQSSQGRRSPQRRPGLSGPGADLAAVHGEITLDAVPGRALPPGAIQGARGWVSGYVVPVLSGVMGGALSIDGATLPFDGVVGYHDHNWGFWEGVRWQWGQVAHGDLSIVYGRVFPPSSVADPGSVPGFLGLLGPDGPIAFSTNVSIDEQGDGGIPRTLDVVAQGNQLDIRLAFSVEESVRSRMSLTRTATGTAMDFLQLGGRYAVTGRGGGRELSFTARGSAETFRATGR
jgi:hypothetical protein